LAEGGGGFIVMSPSRSDDCLGEYERPFTQEGWFNDQCR
jgi:hypothetical protein